MRLPDGRRIRPGDPPLEGPLRLRPGDMAQVTSHEAFNLPANVVGNFGLKSRLARKGLMLLSGFIIDPGWRQTHEHSGQLDLYLANLGDDVIEITPKTDAVGRVQFLTVEGGRHPSVVDPPDKPQRHHSAELGFLKTLKEVTEQHRVMRADFDRSMKAVDWVVMLGFIVLGTALVGIVLEAGLEFATKRDLVDDVSYAVPDDDSGKYLLGTFVLATAVAVHALASWARGRGRSGPVAVGTAGRRGTARRELEFRRDVKPFLGGAFAITAIAVIALVRGDTDAWWPLYGGVIAVSVSLAASWLLRWTRPIQARAIDEWLAKRETDA